MSILLRAAPRAAIRAPLRAPLRQVRAIHVENVVDNTIPGGTKSKTGLAVKMSIFATVAFGLPFFMVYAAQEKAAGA